MVEEFEAEEDRSDSIVQQWRWDWGTSEIKYACDLRALMRLMW